MVSGIAGYGNCFGVPNLGGETKFEPCYSRQSAGQRLRPRPGAHATRSSTPRPRGIGNPVIYVGAKTGRDGIHGATMASEEFNEGSEQKRPNVQVGDPFMEKLLLEACLEAMQTGAIVGIQDMGAAGLTCSTCEMGARGGVGLDVELDLVPQRETGMTAYEIMLSREPGAHAAGRREGPRGRSAARLCQVGTGRSHRGHGDRRSRGCASGITASWSPTFPTSRSPTMRRSTTGRSGRGSARRQSRSIRRLRSSKNCKKPRDLHRRSRRSCWPRSNICSKRWVHEQYDSMVQTNTVQGPGGEAGVMRIKGTGTQHERGLAMALDGNGRWCYLDPKLGAMHAVAEAARKVACTGATPVAATNCLNFGNPEKPEIMAQLSAAIDGIAEACTALGTPITGGNVSLYNETRGEGIYPTPVLGIVGILDDVTKAVPADFQRAGDAILLLGLPYGSASNADPRRR